MPNYSYLKTDIINTIENDSTEFETQISYIVEKAEDRLIKELDDPGLDSFASVAFTASNPTVSLPDGTLVVRNVNYKTSASTTTTPANVKISLLQRTYEYAIDYWGYVSASTGVPRYYARKNNTSIYIVPTPVSTVAGEIQYTKRPLALASATDTSATIYNYFIKDLNSVATWEAKYKNSVDGLRNQARRMRQDDMGIAASPAGGPNPVIQGTN